jgi:hypothetical protein
LAVGNRHRVQDGPSSRMGRRESDASRMIALPSMWAVLKAITRAG